MTTHSVSRGLWTRGLLLLVVAMLAALDLGSPAMARVGGGASFGSRGTRTFSAPATTPTAPSYAQPFQQTEQPGNRPTTGRPFGFGSGLMAGLLGAGLMGALFGGGFFGGIAALLGLLFKLALVGGVLFLIFRAFRGRASGPAFAGGYGAGRAAPLPGAAPQGAPRTTSIAVEPVDYAAFEAALIAVQDAYSREDLRALAQASTPEMVRHLERDLADNRQRGLRNDVSQTRLVRGDLAEAWREGAIDYATVAMRFAAIDVMLDRAGRVASGDPINPVEATELWTFRREAGTAWRLSAIQQAG